MFDPGLASMRLVGLTATTLGSAAFLVAAYHTHESDFVAPKWVVKPLASLFGVIGVYSYGIYLWHVTVLGILERLVARRIFSIAGDGSQAGWLVSALILSGGAIVVGILTSSIVDRPVLRLRDRWFPSRSDFVSVPNEAVIGSTELPRNPVSTTAVSRVQL